MKSSHLRMFGRRPFPVSNRSEGLALVVGITAGEYPAFFLSAFQPVRVLRGKLELGAKNIRFQRALVVVQFAISIVLILGTMMIYKQLIYLKSTDLGFEKEQVVVLPIPPTLSDMSKRALCIGTN